MKKSIIFALFIVSMTLITKTRAGVIDQNSIPQFHGTMAVIVQLIEDAIKTQDSEKRKNNIYMAKTFYLQNELIPQAKDLIDSLKFVGSAIDDRPYAYSSYGGNIYQSATGRECSNETRRRVESQAINNAILECYRQGGASYCSQSNEKPASFDHTDEYNCRAVATVEGFRWYPKYEESPTKPKREKRLRDLEELLALLNNESLDDALEHAKEVLNNTEGEILGFGPVFLDKRYVVFDYENPTALCSEEEMKLVINVSTSSIVDICLAHASSASQGQSRCDPSKVRVLRSTIPVKGHSKCSATTIID